MEFVDYLDKIEIEIMEIVERAGYKTRENTELCKLSDDYVGFLYKHKKEIIICTNNAKKKENYTILRNKNNET